MNGADLRGTGRRGNRTQLTFDYELMSLIATLSEGGKDNDLEMQMLQFKLALILCHEAVHAVWRARNWKAQLHMVMHHKHYGTISKHYVSNYLSTYFTFRYHHT